VEDVSDILKELAASNSTSVRNKNIKFWIQITTKPKNSCILFCYLL